MKEERGGGGAAVQEASDRHCSFSRRHVRFLGMQGRAGVADQLGDWPKVSLPRPPVPGPRAPGQGRCAVLGG